MAISDEFKRKVLEKDELKQILDIKVGLKSVLPYIPELLWYPGVI